MIKQELSEWYTLWLQVKNGYHMEPSDKRRLLSLNMDVMEIAHKIHNDHMLDKTW